MIRGQVLGHSAADPLVSGKTPLKVTESNDLRRNMTKSDVYGCPIILAERLLLDDYPSKSDKSDQQVTKSDLFAESGIPKGPVT